METIISKDVVIDDADNAKQVEAKRRIQTQNANYCKFSMLGFSNADACERATAFVPRDLGKPERGD